MIENSRKEELNLNYSKVGFLRRKKNMTYHLEMFNKLEVEDFNSLEEAYVFIKRKMKVFQNEKEIPLAINYYRDGLEPRVIGLANSKSENLSEFSLYHFRKMNIILDKKRKAFRTNNINLRKAQFNDIARSICYRSPKLFILKTSILSFVLLAFIALTICLTIFMFDPSHDINLISDISHNSFYSMPAYISGLVGAVLSLILISAYIWPLFIYHKTVLNDNGTYSYQDKSFKKAYKSRIISNRITALSFPMILISIGICWGTLSQTTFFKHVADFAESKGLLAIIAICTFGILFEAVVVTDTIFNTISSKKKNLNTYIPFEDIPLFDAWLISRSDKSKDYMFNFDKYYFAPLSVNEMKYIEYTVFENKINVSEKVRNDINFDRKREILEGMNFYSKRKKIDKKSRGI